MATPLAQSVDQPTKIEQDKAQAKKVQNSAFKFFGGIGLAGGIAGFSPSVFKMLTGPIWSVMHNAPHTDNNFLYPHACGCIVWFAALFIQLCTGGTPWKRTHYYSGYVGALGLAIGMFFAFANTILYDVVIEKTPLIGFYTFVLIFGASINGAAGIACARAKRLPEHKDFMIMATMWTLDPALHRLSMWVTRAVDGSVGLIPDPDVLATVGKMPANFLLVTIFGAMAVKGRRANRITVPNITLEGFAFVGGILETFTHLGTGEKDVHPPIRDAVIVLCVAFAVVVLGLIFTEQHLRRKEAARAIADPAISA